MVRVISFLSIRPSSGEDDLIFWEEGFQVLDGWDVELEFIFEIFDGDFISSEYEDIEDMVVFFVED